MIATLNTGHPHGFNVVDVVRRKRGAHQRVSETTSFDLREWRARRRLTRKAAARALGYSDEAYRKAEELGGPIGLKMELALRGVGAGPVEIMRTADVPPATQRAPRAQSSRSGDKLRSRLRALVDALEAQAELSETLSAALPERLESRDHAIRASAYRDCVAHIQRMVRGPI